MASVSRWRQGKVCHRRTHRLRQEHNGPRLLPIRNFDSDRILIDGLDISHMGLHDLRSRLTIVPQNAVLFFGTIRDNLNLFGAHMDEECLTALHSVHIRTMPASTYPSASNSRVVSMLGNAEGAVQHGAHHRSSAYCLDSHGHAGGPTESSDLSGSQMCVTLSEGLISHRAKGSCWPWHEFCCVGCG